MNTQNGRKALSSWSLSVKNSKVRSSNFDTLSGHPQDVCYFPKNPEDKSNTIYIFELEKEVFI